MRCSEHVFKVSYNDDKLNWRPGLAPAIYHKIQGILPTKIKRECSEYDEAKFISLALAREVVEKLLALRMNPSSIAILCGKYVEWQKSIRDQFFMYISQSIPTLEMVEERDLYLLKPNSQMPADQTGLTIVDWFKASLREWSVVILINPLPRHLNECHQLNIVYQRYRAISRATVKLIEITVKYDTEVEEMDVNSVQVLSGEEIEHLAMDWSYS